MKYALSFFLSASSVKKVITATQWLARNISVLWNFYLMFKNLHFTVRHTNNSQVKLVWIFLPVTYKSSILTLSKSKYGKYIPISTLSSKSNYNITTIDTIEMHTVHDKTLNQLKYNWKTCAKPCTRNEHRYALGLLWKLHSQAVIFTGLLFSQVGKC